MSEKFSEVEIVPGYKTNMTKTMNLSSLFQDMLVVSEHQLQTAGIDSENLVKNIGIGWVVIKYHMDVKRMPNIFEKIRLTTSAETYNKFFCYRNFSVKAEDGTELVKVKSIWTMMSIAKRRMVPVRKDIMDKLNCVYSADVEHFPRIPRVEFDDKLTKDYRTRFFDIDVNGHVNNTVYFDWMLDTLNKDFLLQHQIKTMDIKYDLEVHYGETVNSKLKIDDDLTTHHQIESDTGLNAQALFTWK